MSTKTVTNKPSKSDEAKVGTGAKVALYTVLVFLTVVFLGPIFFIILNSFKNKLAIADSPFALPLGEMWVGLENYAVGLMKEGFLWAILWSFVITILSVAAIVFFSALTAYYITRVKTWWTSALYYLFVFSMVIPFQMVMFPTVKIADMLHLNNPIGIVVLYLGFGSGLSVFMFAGFVKSIPLDIEEAAMIDGCSPLQNYFRVVLPMLKPTAVTVAILNAMWVWNDYLLPYLVIGLSTKYKTIPVVVQSFVGSNGNRDMGAMMAMLVLAIIPIVIFYVATQKHIIEGVAAGAVKG
ncbi:carbohydrate ABC transporter permease [Corynebacterium glucuronolyticum]|uniref:Carbohydrate ABC transporter permease n=2 Tax=Corynebacterium glucuronolyticum TaxID=39791 RepID=A0A7T4JVT9_9CORY|nr:carbohydrate ABC transporter permease [Corynebacterium glucuronolyticum]EEI64266.1 ABC transporter, permease protein [Corynebacterium glucuronolyticum ATCC 51866]MCT1442292.1 carbohydrate ABC transporter permease [Corynebacterium glucuronolyticum]QQB47264.1 carbohydrate ABC transporter permease [Corynebacterium glucuronolyticum]QQU88923.1 carbohydrate ABC transporter permease [Corynebacterium glucuronolyticum]QRP70195.1 carbohydrate ABC transporter permease [Corynebacterium glucuronolyticum